jgi:hypothetical protein
MPFNRTNIPDSFSLRVAGGAHFLIGTNWLTATNDAQTNLVLSVPGTVSAGSFVAESNLVVGNGQVFLNSSGTSWLQLDGTNIQFRATNGVTGRIQIIYE